MRKYFSVPLTKLPTLNSLYHARGNFALTLARDRLEDTLHFHMKKFGRSPPKWGSIILILRSQLRITGHQRGSLNVPWKETHSMHTDLIDSANIKVHWCSLELYDDTIKPVYLFVVSRCVCDLLKYSQRRLNIDYSRSFFFTLSPLSHRSPGCRPNNMFLLYRQVFWKGLF